MTAAGRAESLRLFVACELSDEIRAALARVQEELRQIGAGKLRWVRPEGIHITFKFLGQVESERVPEMTAALVSAIEPFRLRLAPARLGGFGGARIRVVWVGVEGDTDGLAAIAQQVERALTPLGYPAERRPFNPHLTLARVPDRMPASERGRLAGLVRDHRLAPLPSMIVTNVGLIQSVLGPGGSVYHKLATFPPGK